MTPEASSSTLVLNDESGLPPGYSIHVASGGVKYAVPKFLLAAAHTSFEAEAKKREFKIDEDMAMVNLISFFFCSLFNYRFLFSHSNLMDNQLHIFTPVLLWPLSIQYLFLN